MPVTAKLSRGFYERFGDDLTNELVDWLNAVDATYRSDLRETNELNFARFMASVDQRFAEQDARIEKRFADQEVKLEKRFAEQDVKLEKRFAEQDVKLEKRFAELGGGLENRFGLLERRFGQIDARFGELRADLLKWMIGLWTGTILTMVGLFIALLKLR